MTKSVFLFAVPLEFKTLTTALIFASLHAQLDLSGEAKTANVFLSANIHGKLSLKTVFRSARSHANLANGGEKKISHASQYVRLHGSKVPHPTVFQLALAHAAKDYSGGLMTTLAPQSAILLEFKTLTTVSPSADLHANLASGGKMKIPAVTQSAATHGYLRLKTVSRFATSHASHAKCTTLRLTPAVSHVMPHGKKTLLTMCQFVKSLVILASSGEQMIKLVSPNARHPESKTLIMMLISADHHAKLENSSIKTILTAKYVNQPATILSSPSLLMVS